jgi:hypothetical protein
MAGKYDKYMKNAGSMLAKAVVEADVDYVKRLLELNMDINSNEFIKNNGNLLHWAIRGENPSNELPSLNTMIQAPASGMTYETKELKLKTLARDKIVNLIIDRSTDINKKSHRYGFSALHFAVLKDDCKMAELLLKAGANPNIKTDYLHGKRWIQPLHIAAACDHDDMIDILIKGGADLNAVLSEKWTALLISVFSLFYKRCPPTAIKKMIKYGADLNLSDKDGVTPLHWAVDLNNVKVVKLLINSGANVDSKDKYSRKPLDIAYANECQEITLMLENKTKEYTKDFAVPSFVLKHTKNIPGKNLKDERSKYLNYLRNGAHDKKYPIRYLTDLACGFSDQDIQKAAITGLSTIDDPRAMTGMALRLFESWGMSAISHTIRTAAKLHERGGIEAIIISLLFDFRFFKEKLDVLQKELAKSKMTHIASQLNSFHEFIPRNRLSYNNIYYLKKDVTNEKIVNSYIFGLDCILNSPKECCFLDVTAGERVKPLINQLTQKRIIKAREFVESRLPSISAIYNQS